MLPAFLLKLGGESMEAVLSIIIGILEQGFIYGVMALGVYITYRILDFPDL